MSQNARKENPHLQNMFKLKVMNRSGVLTDGKNASDTEDVETRCEYTNIKRANKVKNENISKHQKSSQKCGHEVFGSQNDSKYDLGLPCLAAKCKKIKEAKLLHLNSRTKDSLGSSLCPICLTKLRLFKRIKAFIY